jgi:hypothetical protein
MSEKSFDKEMLREAWKHNIQIGYTFIVILLALLCFFLAIKASFAVYSVSALIVVFLVVDVLAIRFDQKNFSTGGSC